MPEMTLAHTLYKEIVPAVLQVELKRGEQETPFSSSIGSIRVVYGIPVLVQILTALGKDTLERSQYSYYSGGSSRRSVLSHLLKVRRKKRQQIWAARSRGPTSQKSVLWRWPCMQSSGSPWWRNI